MCTTFAKKVDNKWFLGKTRDPVPWMRWDDEMKLFDTKADRFKKLIIQNPDEKEDGYYGGINEKGVAYISTFVGVAEGQVSYIRRPYVRLILDAETAEEAVEIIKSFNPRIGGNMFVADKKKCFGIEGVPQEYFVEEVKDAMVKTNHFVKIKKDNLSFAIPGFRDWSMKRYKRAVELLKGADSLDDLKEILRDRGSDDVKNAICRTDKDIDCFTHSAFIFNTFDTEAYYAQGNPLENEFGTFGFSKGE